MPAHFCMGELAMGQMDSKGAVRRSQRNRQKKVSNSSLGLSHVEGLECRVLLSTSVGSPDLTFGTSGKTTTQILAPATDVGRATAVQSDGKIIVAGSSTSS